MPIVHRFRAALPPARPPAVSLVLALALALPATVPAAAQLPGAPATPGAQAEPAAPAPPQVEVATSPAEDRAIAQRLRSIYASVDGLSGVAVAVDSGVVHLTGEAASAEARDQAERIARQLRGVVEVQNDLREVRSVERRLRPAMAKLRDRLATAVAALPLFGVALAIFLVFWLLARGIAAWETPFRRLIRNRFLADLWRQAIGALVLVAGAVLALEVLDATRLVAAVAGAAGLAGLAIGFAFRDLVENYIASVLLSLRQPFLPNDHVVIEGQEGRVVRLTSRATVLMTLDGNHVRIPNADVFKGVILNYTRNPRRRFDFTVGVATGVDLAAALRHGLDTLEGMEGVLDDPPPQGWIDTLADSSVTLHFFAWIDQRASEWAKARSEAIRRLKEGFDAAGVDMPAPWINVRMAAEGEGEAAAAEDREAPAPPAEPALDISRDTHLDREVAEDRAAAPGEDLLDPRAPTE